MSRRLAAAIPLAAIAAFGAVLAIAPDYVLAPSLPLDDAWTHAVYARSLATTGRFEFTPGAPAGGPASPLWASVMALPHLVARETGDVVLLVKLAGSALHALTALILFYVLTGGQGLSPERLLGPLLVAVHPDLISASLSGVEVPLATTAACALVWAAQRAPGWAYGGLALVVPFVRPELAVLSLAFPPLMHGHDRARLWRLGAAGLGGTLAAFGLMAAHLAPHSSVPRQSALPGTNGAESVAIVGREVLGFTRLLDQFPVADAGLLIIIAAVAAAYFVSRAPAVTPELTAASAMLGGLSFCAVAFAFLPPVVPGAFYAQRHALPALPLLVGAIPILAYESLRRLLPPRTVTVVRVAVPLLLVSSVILDMPIRYRYLANDARNIDEIQVAMARTLGRGPSSQVVWASDGGGALRYFGRGVVIDLSGVNTRAVQTPDAEVFLDAHRPNFIEIVPRLSSIDGTAARGFPAMSFNATTPDSAAGTPQYKHQRWLVACADASRPERFHLRERVFGFRCGEGNLGLLPGPSR